MPASTFAMIYETTPTQTIFGTWRIEPVGKNASWLLKWKGRGEPWIPCHGFDSPKAAAFAVGIGRTGVSEWDTLAKGSAGFEIEQWTKIELGLLTPIATTPSR